MKAHSIGLDVGSTTAKVVMTDGRGEVIFTAYERHNANVAGVIARLFERIAKQFGDVRTGITVTGSVGMGLAERFSLPFVQEVVAATRFVSALHPEISTIIDIGGEDAKIVYMNPNGNADLRMNGNCAGGTGAFIDQMALLLGVELAELNELAGKAERKYPIASRCGVFSKTDIQNLVSKNVSKADIAASIFHAVALQTIVTLSHGCEITPKILFCGGPLTFIPALRQAFVDYLRLSPGDYLVPEGANLIPAWGAALSENEGKTYSVSELSALMGERSMGNGIQLSARLPRIFESEEAYAGWRAGKESMHIARTPLEGYKGDAYLGVDSGSTTTKIVVTDDRDGILYTYYAPNEGNPIRSVHKGLARLESRCREAGAELRIKGSCSTGYGEDLIKAAYGFGSGVIETIAHFAAARKVNPDVSFILDIGGQDMKAIFVDNGVLSRMEINEACSSGCGSFLETFANSLDYPVARFAHMACLAESPCDLGTRCTVFMNSKVKQVLREGATVADIAAGLSYSVVKNCLYKVLKLKKAEELGDRIVVQGGTMRNDSVVRVLELLTGTEVGRSDIPELMGAYGCALYARTDGAATDCSVSDLVNTASYDTRGVQCRGCENQCLVHRYSFANGNTYFSGNKCEKVFSNLGGRTAKGRNLSDEKYRLLFDRPQLGSSAAGRPVIGIPRALNMYENYPFWHALFGTCGIRTVLSSPSTFAGYEAGVHSVMSDNICFPAKLVHSHIYELAEAGVDRIFMPWVVFEKTEGPGVRNSYNCPIVAGYSEVVKSAINPAVPVDAPVFTFKDRALMEKCCTEYLSGLGVDKTTIRRAVAAAVEAQDQYEARLQAMNAEAYEHASREGRITILLAGRPYHTDPLVQHKISDMIAGMGVTVVTEDIVRGDTAPARRSHHVSQWSYINRILRAAHWVAERGDDVHFVELTSFGCGPDAFLIDEIKSVLARRGKSLTLLKIDDVNNVGSLRLRVRSLVESLRLGQGGSRRDEPFLSTKVYTKEDRPRTILIPYFTDYVSPLIPSVFKLAGYDAVQLPLSDTQTAEYGLAYANNEVCYPATLVVGDLIKALDSGRYDLSRTAVIITQTGGQCRASNYIELIKKGVAEAGFPQVPVLSMALGSGNSNEQYGFTIPWIKIVPVALAAILFGDVLSKFYHASAVREKTPGEALRLRDHYLEAARGCIEANSPSAVYALIPEAARAFNAIIEDVDRPRVGIVGEIFLKFNSFAHKDVTKWLTANKVEVVPPMLADFFMQSFVNRNVKKDTNVARGGMPRWLNNGVYSWLWTKMCKVNRLASEFRYYIPFHNIFEQAEHGKEVISLSAQFGEGWLLPAEVVTYARMGVNNVISLQPFGCIANHIVSKGIEKKIKTRYPQMNLLSLDFDSGVSDVNVTNRLMLLVANIK